MPSVTFSGGLDVSRHREIVETFKGCADGGRFVVVDLSAAKSIDSAFIGELILFVRRNERAGRRVVVIANGNIARLLVVAGIDKKVAIVLDRARAEKAMEDFGLT